MFIRLWEIVALWKILALGIASVVLVTFSGCGSSVTPPDGDSDSNLYDAEVEARLDRVGYFITSLDGTEEKRMFFDVYLDRPDLGLTEPDSGDVQSYSYELDEEQHVDKLYVKTDPDSRGVSCSSNAFPHRCDIDAPGSYWLEVYFGDGGHAITTLEVPDIPLKETPTLQSPTTTPAPDLPLSLTFSETGADDYFVMVHQCDAYSGEGSNPCFSTNFEFYRTYDASLCDYNSCYAGDSFLMTGSLHEATVYDSWFDYEDGQITLTSDIPLEFNESVIYEICGNFSGELDQGVTTFVQSCDYKEFWLES